MFMGTLIGPFFNHLIVSSLSGFNYMILTGGHVKSGIKGGKIQVVASSNVVKKTFNGKKETNDVYGQKGLGKNGRNQSVERY